MISGLLRTIGRSLIGQRNGFAIAKIVCINARAFPREPAMAGLFDVSKEIILVTGASARCHHLCEREN